jgi:hypothetical protein
MLTIESSSIDDLLRSERVEGLQATADLGWEDNLADANSGPPTHTRPTLTSRSNAIDERQMDVAP